MAALLDTQGPLNRRKALIARLMGQMSGTTGSTMSRGATTLASRPFVGGSVTRTASAERSPNLIPNLVPAHTREGVGASSGPPVLPTVAAAPTTQESQPVGPQGGEPVAPSAPVVAPWQAGGYVSEDAYRTFSQLSELEQQRILQNPVTRRRYFT